jgi:hypothetical protein
VNDDKEILKQIAAALEEFLQGWFEDQKSKTRIVFDEYDKPKPTKTFHKSLVQDQIDVFYKEHPEYEPYRRHVYASCNGPEISGCYCCGLCLGPRVRVQTITGHYLDYDELAKLALHESDHTELDDETLKRLGIHRRPRPVMPMPTPPMSEIWNDIKQANWEADLALLA